MIADFITLGSAARGTIQPRKDQQNRLEEFVSRVSTGEFHAPIANNLIPVRCVDGRSTAVEVSSLAPNAAGGSESLFVADDLTVKRFAANDGSVLGGYKNTLKCILKSDYEVGGHTDSHAQGEKSGCGANDRLPEIYQYIATKGVVLRSMTQALGTEVDEGTHELITKNAAGRTEFSAGAEIFKVLSKIAKPECVDTLYGEHNEVAVVVNKKNGTTLDRMALASEFGSNYQAFNADVWAFEKAAEVGSESQEETRQKLIAMVYYNLATTLVLAGPELHIIVLEAS